VIGTEERQQLHEKVRKRVVGRIGERSADSLCLYWAHYGLQVLKEAGIEVCLQAGSAYWPRVDNPRETPEHVMTHFGYKWEPDSNLSRLSVRLGHLPEMHIWLGIVETQELVDFSTGTWPQACRDRIGEWETQDPPPYYWGPPGNLPEDVVYEPHAKATILAGHIIDRLEAVLGGVGK